MLWQPGMRNHFLSSLTPEEFDALSPNFRNIVLEPGRVLWRRGDVINHVVLPHNGVISLGMPTDHDHSVECALVGREGIAGDFAGCGVSHAISSATVRIAGTATQVDTDAFRQAISCMEPLRERLMHYGAAQCGQALQIAACNASHPVEGRLCRWLLEMHDRTESSRLAITQHLLANMLGVRRTTVTFVAGALQDRGAIKWQRNCAVVLRRDILETKTCDCYGELKSHTGRLLNEKNPKIFDGAVVAAHRPASEQVAV